MARWVWDLASFIGSICLIIVLYILIVEVLIGYRTSDLLKKIKNKLTQNNDDYKDFVRTTESYGRVVELPFSVIQPLLRDDSPIILVAQNDRLAIKDENCRNGIYIKLSKKDYNEYIKFLEQKKVNKQILKKTEDTLAAIQLINKELKRINDEAMKSVKKETENLNKFTEMYRQIRTEEEAENLNNLAEVCQYVRTEKLMFDEKPIEKPVKFDWELFDSILKGKTSIIMKDINEYFQFRTSGLADIIHCNTSNTIGYPRVAYYNRVTDQWFIAPYGCYGCASIYITELFERCPDFVRMFNRKIQNTGVRYD